MGKVCTRNLTTLFYFLKDFYEIFHHLSEIQEGGARRGVLTVEIDVNESRDRRPTTLWQSTMVGMRQFF